MVFDYAKEGNLKKHVEVNGSLSEENALEFLKQMLETLTFMENNNLLHLDIKPANILLYKGRYILSDWGNYIEGSLPQNLCI